MNQSAMRREVWETLTRHALTNAGYETAVQPAGADPGQCVVRARRGGVEVEVRVRPHGKRDAWTELRSRSAGVPVELTVRPELAGEGIDKLLGMTVDLEVGDAGFDGRFVVEAAPERVARAVLREELRAALCALPVSDDGPVLRVSEGAVAVGFRGEPGLSSFTALRALELALDAHSALHEGIDEAVAAGPFRQGAESEGAVDPRAREAGRERLRKARRRAVAVVAGAATVGVGFLTSVLVGGRFLHALASVVG